MGVKTRRDSWVWIVTQAQEHVRNPQWKRADPAGELGVTLSKISHQMRSRHYSLYDQPHMAREWFRPRRIVCLRRTGNYQWELVPQGDRQRNVYPSFGTFWSVMERNLDRRRRRWLPVRASPLSEKGGPISFDGGSVVRVRPDGEILPAERQTPLRLSPSFDLVNSEFYC